MYIRIIILSISLATVLSAKFFEVKKETWFYGVDPIEIPDNNETKVPKKKVQTVVNRMEQEQKFMQNIPFNSLDQLSAQEYREMLDKTKDIATMHPTQQNVSTYMRLQKFATDKADQFQEKWQLATIQDPTLTYGISTSKFGRNNSEKNKIKEKKEFIENMRKHVTMIMFYDESNMQDAQTQLSVYKMMERTYHLKVATISITANPSYIKQLELKSFPEHWVYYDDKEKTSWQRIGGGVIPMDTLLSNFQLVFKKN